jgi:hypothetical protein
MRLETSCFFLPLSFGDIVFKAIRLEPGLFRGIFVGVPVNGFMDVVHVLMEQVWHARRPGFADSAVFQACDSVT